MGLCDGYLRIYLDIEGNHIKIPDHSWSYPVWVARTGNCFYCFEYLIVHIDIFDAIHQFHIRIDENANRRFYDKEADD